MGGSEADVARVRETLARLIEISGLSRREIERRLALEGRGIDLTRLLAGRFELKLRQVLDLIQVLEVHPLELFRLIYTEPERRSPLLARVQAIFTSAKPGTGAERGGTRPVEREVEDLRRQVADLSRAVEAMRSRLR